MLFFHFGELCRGILVVPLIILVCVVYTYFVNMQRKADDPKKRQYHPLAIILAPFTFFLFLSAGIFLFLVRALLFAGFLIIFTVLLITLRKPFLFEWWHKFATKIGDPLLEFNTRLIKIAFGFQAWQP